MKLLIMQIYRVARLLLPLLYNILLSTTVCGDQCWLNGRSH
jgi:hypothetical protein